MKRILPILIAITLIICGGCKSKKQVLDKPDNLINRSTMVNIIADSYIIESTVHLAPDSINKQELTKQYYRELFDRYHITREQFIASIDYYVGEESSAEKLLSDASAALAKKKKQYNVPTPSNNNTPTEAPGSAIDKNIPGLDTL